MSTYLDCILRIADTIPGYSAEQLRAELAGPKPQPSADRAMSVAEAAQRLTISLSTAHKWIASGRLPSRHIGSRVVIMQSAIEELLSNG